MSALPKLLVPIVLILGACDSDQPEVAPAEVASSSRDDKHVGRFARLDVDRDGSITEAEIAGDELAPLFAELDGDGDDRLSKDEYLAFKKARHAAKVRKRGQANG